MGEVIRALATSAMPGTAPIMRVADVSSGRGPRNAFGACMLGANCRHTPARDLTHGSPCVGMTNHTLPSHLFHPRLDHGSHSATRLSVGFPPGQQPPVNTHLIHSFMAQCPVHAHTLRGLASCVCSAVSSSATLRAAPVVLPSPFLCPPAAGRPNPDTSPLARAQSLPHPCAPPP